MSFFISAKFSDYIQPLLVAHCNIIKRDYVDSAWGFSLKVIIVRVAWSPLTFRERHQALQLELAKHQQCWNSGRWGKALKPWVLKVDIEASISAIKLMPHPRLLSPQNDLALLERTKILNGACTEQSPRSAWTYDCQIKAMPPHLSHLSHQQFFSHSYFLYLLHILVLS